MEHKVIHLASIAVLGRRLRLGLVGCISSESNLAST